MQNENRRQFISRLGTGMVAAGAASLLKPVLAKEMPAASPLPVPFAALKQAAAQKGILFGAAEAQKHLAADPKLARAFAAQNALLVPEWELKWDFLRPTPTTYSFDLADWLLQFAQQSGMKFRGHTFLWYQSLPNWFDSYATPSNAQQLLQSHIATVSGRYAGKMHSWDVVNEVLEPNDKRSDGLRNTPWLKLLGPDHIEFAFRTAAQADPHALLIWNENYLEEDSSRGETKRTFFIRHLQDLQSKKVPIHGIGIQSHLVGDHANIAGTQFQQFLATVGAMGLKIIVSELDVQDQNLPGEISSRDQKVADVYYRYLSAVLQEKSAIAVITWGTSNAYSWLRSYKPRADGAPVRALPLDEDMNPTPVHAAIAKAFQEASPR